MITLHTWSTPNGRKVSIALEELGLPYQVRTVNIGKDEQFDPAFLKLNSNHKIPVIEDDQGPGATAEQPFVLSESGAILLYLAERTGKLMPTEPVARYTALQWLMFQMGGVGPMFGQRHHFRNQAPDEAYGMQRYTKETHRLYKVLDQRLGEAAHLAGDEYSMADIATYPWVARWQWHDLDWSALPNVKRWFDALGERPGVQRGMAVPVP